MQDVSERAIDPTVRHRYQALALPLCLLALACDGGTQRAAFPAPLAPDQASITPATARAASALSIVNAAPPPQADAFGNALQCAAAIRTASDRLRQNSLATQEILGEMDRVARFYERSLLDLAAEKNWTRSQTVDELEKTRAFMEQRLPETGRTAIACIREQASDRS